MAIVFDNVNYNNTIFIDKIMLKEENIYSFIGKECNVDRIADLASGLIRPTTGKIIFDHLLINKDSTIDDISLVQNKIAVLPRIDDDYYLCRYVKSELQSNCINQTVDINKKMVAALNMVGLDSSLLNREIKSLSFSEKRLLLIADCLIQNPRILVLNQPTVGLDYMHKKNLEMILLKLKKRYGKIIIVNSRDTEFLNRVTDQIIVINNDGKVYIDSNESVFSNQKVMDSFDMHIPNTISFSNLVSLKKNINLGYRNDINDLIKDIYRNIN